MAKLKDWERKHIPCFYASHQLRKGTSKNAANAQHKSTGDQRLAGATYDNITLLKTLLSMQSTTFSWPRTRGCTLPGLVFVDMNKAFDRVEHQTLIINDLRNIGVHGLALKWFINYLTDRHQQVRCGNTVSAPTSCCRGVPQGSVLGPLLFLL